MRTPHWRLSLRARPASLVVAVAALAVGGGFAPGPVHALEPGPGVTSGRLLPVNPSGHPSSVGFRSITPDYMVYTDPGLANPYEGQFFSVRRVADGSLVTKLPSNMPTRNAPLVSGNSVVQVEDSINGTQVTARPLDQKGRTWTVRVPPGYGVLDVTQEGMVATLPRGTASDCAVVLLRDGQDDLVLPMRMACSSGDRLIVTGDGRTMVMSNGLQLWTLNLVTGDARLLATKDVGSFDRIQMTANRAFWVDAERVALIWQDRVSWVGLDGSAGGNVVVADPGNVGYNAGYIAFGDRLAVLHIPSGRPNNQPDLEPLDLTTGARQPAVASFVTAAHGVADGRAVLVTGDTPNGRIVEVGDDGAAPRTIVDLPVNAKVMSLIRLNGGRVDADFGDPHSSIGPIANIAADGTSSTWSNAPKAGLPDIEGGLVDVSGDTWLTVKYDTIPNLKATYRLSWPGGQRDVGEYPGALGRGGQLWASGGSWSSDMVAVVYDVRTGLKLATVPAPKPIVLDGTTIWQSPDAEGVMTGTDATGARPLQVVNTGLIGCGLLDGQVAGRWALVSCPNATTWAVDLSGVLAPWKLPEITAQHYELSLGNGFVTWVQLVDDSAGQQYMQAVVLDLGPGHQQRLYGPLHGMEFPPWPVVAPDDAGAARMVYLDAVRQARVVDLDWLTPPPTAVAAAPTGAAATAGNAQAVLSWTTPANDGGAAITGYTVTASPGGKRVTTTGATTGTVTGLTNGTAYTFTVTATNAAGTSLASWASAAVTPRRTVAGAPSGVSATAGNAQAAVSWTAPDSDGGSPVTGYTVTATPGGKTVTTTGATTATVIGLANGTEYTFMVTATNTVGTSSASDPSTTIIPAGLPTGPGTPEAAAGNRQATITWTAAGDSGSPVTSYVVTATPGSLSVFVAGTARRALVTGLSNGTSYRFSVAASNAVGTSPSVLTTAIIPIDPAVPTVAITGRPAALTASAGATFSFSSTDGSDAAGSLHYLCTLDAIPASACTSPRAYAGLSSAAHTFTVRVTDPSGNTGTATSTWRVDRVVPTVAMTAPRTVHALTTSLAPAWSAKDVGGGLANVDVRWARAAYNGGFTSAVYPRTWQKTPATRTTLSRVAPGYTYCFSARARDKAGNLSTWSAPRCSAVALDDRSLTASKGWARGTGSGFYQGTATTTSRSALTLTRTRVQAKRIYLVATRCRTCGTVGVYWNGTLIKKVNLYASTTQRRSVLAIRSFTSVRRGSLTIRTLTRNKTVQIDGVALVRG